MTKLPVRRQYRLGLTPVPTTSAVIVSLIISATGLLVYCVETFRLNGPLFFSLVGPLLGLGLLALASSLWIAQITIDAVGLSNSLVPAGRQFRRLRLRILLSLLSIPVFGWFLHIGNWNVALGVIFADTLLLQSLPMAVLLAKQRARVVNSVFAAQWIGAILALEMAPTNDGIATTITIAVLAVIGGSVVLSLFALWLSSIAPAPAQDADLWAPLPLHRRPPGASLCAPFILTMFQARHLLESTSAGVSSIAALFAGYIVIIAGLGFAARSLSSDGVDETLSGLRGARTCFVTAALLAGTVIALGPVFLRKISGDDLVHLERDLIALCLAAIGWAVASYASWFRVAHGGSGYPFVAGSALAIGSELVLGMWWKSDEVIVIFPFFGLCLYLLAFLVHSGHVEHMSDPEPVPREQRTPISVGVMAYNEERCIEASLTAFMQQASFRTSIGEIIVISSASTDGTNDVVRRLAEKDSRIRLIVEDEKRGKVFSVNHFLSEAANSICIIASADVTPAVTCVEHLADPILDRTPVAMTGPRVEPRYRKGFVPMMHRFLWDMHNHANSVENQAKLGEIVAVRKEMAIFEPIAGCDEVLLEASVIASGGATRFVADAVVYNTSPTSFAEYVQHRRRIHAMHLVTEDALGYRASTVDAKKGIGLLFGEILRHPYFFLPAIACSVAEAWGRALGRRDVQQGESFLTWDPTASARNTNTHDLGR